MSLHPTKRNIKFVPRSTAVHTGLNRDGQPLSDDRYRRCLQCGYMCHLDRDLRVRNGGRTGDGITTSDSSYTAQDGTTTLYYGDPTVNSGCPFCGSQRWDR